MADKITVDAGDEAEGLNIGKGNQQQHANPRQSMRAGDINFSNQDSFLLWGKLLELGGDIRDIRFLNTALNTKMDDMLRRVIRLEDTEVVVRQEPEMAPRPTASREARSETTNLSLQTVLIIVLAVVVGAAVLVAALVYIQVTNG